MWRRHRSYRSSSSSLSNLASILLLGFGGLVVAVVGYKLLFASRVGKYDRFNVVLAGTPVELLSLDVTTKSAVAVFFPSDLYMTQTHHGYGGYRISAVYTVGQLDRRGGETLADTVGDYVGVPVDGYIVGSFNTSQSPSSVVISPGLVFAKDANIDFFDRLRLIQEVLTLRPDKITTVHLSDWSSSLILADGSTATVLDPGALDTDLSGYFFEDKLRNEKWRVEVLNSTDVSGLGNRAARMLANIGATVINVGDIGIALPHCKISAVKAAEQSATVARIAGILACSVEEKVESGRADISVILGRDYADSFVH